MKTSISRFLQNKSGNITLLFGLSLVPAVVAGGVGVDYARLSGQRTQIQAALDSAVLAGVQLQGDARKTTAKTVFLANLPQGVTLTSENYDIASDGTLTGTVEAKVAMKFGSFVSKSEYKVDAKSAARMGPPTTKTVTSVVPVPATPPAGGCVLVLDPSGSQALLVNSGAQLKAPDCEVHVKSTAQPAAIFNSGASLETKRFCIAGTNVIENSIKVANLQLGCSTVNDNFAGKLPAPSTTCTINGQNYSGKVKLSPGVYCGWFNFNAATEVSFDPGTYVIKDGGWNVNGGSFKGDEVTFFFPDTSKIQFNSDMDTDLSPPKSGVLKGVLFYEDGSKPKSDFIFNNAIRNKMDGLIYLPSRNVTFNADSKLGNDKTTIVVHRLIWNNVKLHLKPNEDVPLFTEGTVGIAGATGGTTTVTTVVTVPGIAQLVR